MKLPILQNVPAALESVVRWLDEFRMLVVESFKTVHDYDTLYAEPAKLSIGMVRYFGAAVSGTTIAHEGLWQYTSVGWKEVGMAPTRYNDYVVSGTSVRNGASAPSFDAFNGVLYLPAFSNTTEEYAYFTIHILHDIKKGTTPTFHVHWSHNIASGSYTPDTQKVVWEISYAIARGYGSGTFSSVRTLTVTPQFAGSQYEHLIAGDDSSCAMHSADVALLEPDCVIIGRIARKPANAADDFANKAFLIQIDMHYEVGQFGTVEKNRAFTAEGFDA